MRYDIEYRRNDTGREEYWYVFMCEVEGYSLAARIADNLQTDFRNYVTDVRLVEA